MKAELRRRPLWQTELANSVTSPAELLRMLDLDPEQIAGDDIRGNFPLRVPRGYVRRMARGDINDPLLRQVLPVREETVQTPGFGPDPLQELKNMPEPGLLHKYHGRALLTVTGACAIHCRYCFRRHFPYSEANPGAGDWQSVIRYLCRHTDINELILSGGDPLSLSNQRLVRFSEQLGEIPHLQILRIHTRMPVVLPERIEQHLLEWLDHLRLKAVVVIHCNHANEINDEVADALSRLANAGATLLNQSVLLKGINDTGTDLARLSEVLFATGVLPYYLHQLDHVAGAAHLEVDDRTACTLMDELHAVLPGYLVPRLVREEPGKPGKTLLWPTAR